MVDLKKRFPQCKVGLSDHTLGITVPIAATALGARVIEKNVTLKRPMVVWIPHFHEPTS